MTRRWPFLLPLLLLAGLLGLLAWELRPGAPLVPPASPMIGRPAPDFALPPPEPGKAGLGRADLAGGVAVVNFFASWCAPCRAEHPLLASLAGRGDVRLFGIAYKDRPEATRRFLAELGDPFARIGADVEGRVGIEFGLTGVPETYVIDRAGIIRYRLAQPLTQERLESEILPLIAELAR